MCGSRSRPVRVGPACSGSQCGNIMGTSKMGSSGAIDGQGAREIDRAGALPGRQHVKCYQQLGQHGGPRVTPDTIPQTVLFPDLFDKPLFAQLHQERASFDGGAILLKTAERTYGLVKALAGCLFNTRAPDKIRHLWYYVHMPFARAICPGSTPPSVLQVGPLRDPQVPRRSASLARIPASTSICECFVKPPVTELNGRGQSVVVVSSTSFRTGGHG